VAIVPVTRARPSCCGVNGMNGTDLSGIPGGDGTLDQKRFMQSCSSPAPSMSYRLEAPDPPRPVRTRLPAEVPQASMLYLMTQLTDEDPRVRRRAAGALGKLQDVGALDSLIIALHDRDLIVQQAVIAALGAIGDPRAIPPLRQLRPQVDRRLQGAIEEAHRAIAASQAYEAH
jgi:hypothetical protein